MRELDALVERVEVLKNKMQDLLERAQEKNRVTKLHQWMFSYQHPTVSLLSMRNALYQFIMRLNCC